MFCNKCGKQINDTDSKCPNCQNEVNAPNSAQQASSFIPNSNIPKITKKKPFYKKWWVWVLAIFVVIFIAAINSEDTPTATTSNSTVSTSTESTTSTQATEKSEPSLTSNTDSKAAETTPTTEKDKKNTDVYDLYAKVQENEAIPYTIVPKAKEFLISNHSLFPAKSVEELNSFVDKTIAFKHLAKNVSNYGDKLMYLPRLGVIQISETDIGNGTFFTEINVSDADTNQYYILYMGQLADVFENDEISVYGLPLDMSSFDNVEGGQTITPVIAGSYIKKLEVQN